MTREVLALGLTLLVHVIGAAVLVGMIARNTGADLFGWWPGEDEGGGGPDLDPRPVAPEPSGGLPLPDARQAAVRLRQPERIADAYPRPARRPSHAPEPARVPARDR